MMSSLAAAGGVGRDGEGKGVGGTIPGTGIGAAAKGELGPGLGRGEQSSSKSSSGTLGGEDGKDGKESSVLLPLVNKAGGSRSPYVRGHMNNPVAWQLWGDEAIERARKENKLMFVSIGYSACHCACVRRLHFLPHYHSAY
jgi:hypothetical protein